jgi:AbrB family looped-hinge helix DNA binding protein
MKATVKTDAVWFSTKGQVVIPAWLRKQYHIQEGTKAIVEAAEDGILIKPVTAATIRRLRGILRPKPGGKTLADEWADHKREERLLEEGKYARGAGSR